METLTKEQVNNAVKDINKNGEYFIHVINYHQPFINVRKNDYQGSSFSVSLKGDASIGFLKGDKTYFFDKVEEVRTNLNTPNLPPDIPNLINNLNAKVSMIRGTFGTSKVPLNEDIFHLSLHYKGDDYKSGNGINLHFGANGQSDLGVDPKEIVKICETSHEGFMKCWKEEGEAFIEEMFGQLECAVKIYNEQCKIALKGKDVGMLPKAVDFAPGNDQKLIHEAFTIICINIWSLTKIGKIKDDEYNGVMWTRIIR